MPTNNSTEVTLHICFGVFGVIGTIATLASLHHRDSLGCVLFRHFKRPRLLDVHNDDLEAAGGALEDVDNPVDDDTFYERRPTLPPAYEHFSEHSASTSANASDLEVDVANGRITTIQAQPKSN
ncbi:Nn.00g064510.m01.CDS01 [Neocucurbitaria sp. VM-36]